MYLWEGAGFERVKTAAFWVVLRAVNFPHLVPYVPPAVMDSNPLDLQPLPKVLL